MKVDDVQGDDSIIEDRRGQSGGSGGGGLSIGKGGKIGIPALIMLVVLFVAKGGLGGLGGGGGSMLPTDMLNQISGGDQATSEEVPAADASTDDGQRKWLRQVSTIIQDYWEQEFGKEDKTYEPASLVVFDSPTSTGCGVGSPETGPFYCPPDKKVYIDLGFYQQLESQLGFDGDFAMAYVIAHEWGHHIQNLLGINEQVQQQTQGASQEEANQLSVKMELQADCFGGVWAKSAYDEGRLEKGDLDEALNAAAAVGDDRIQEKTQGRIDPESFTHGTAAQRQKWFDTGYESGDPSTCNTFG